MNADLMVLSPLHATISAATMRRRRDLFMIGQQLETSESLMHISKRTEDFTLNYAALTGCMT